MSYKIKDNGVVIDLQAVIKSAQDVNNLINFLKQIRYYEDSENQIKIDPDKVIKRPPEFKKWL